MLAIEWIQTINRYDFMTTHIQVRVGLILDASETVDIVLGNSTDYGMELYGHATDYGMELYGMPLNGSCGISITCVYIEHVAACSRTP